MQRDGWHCLLISCALTALLFLSACSPDKPAVPVAKSALLPPPSRFTAISVYPEKVSLTAGEGSHRLQVTGMGTNGFETTLTNATLVSDHPEIAAVDSSGMVRGLKAGNATISAKVDKHVSSVAITIVEAPDEKRMSFINDVLPVLSKAGCNAGACHAKPDGQNGFKLSVFAYDPKSDYGKIVKDDRGRRIFPAAPEESLLLKKPTLAVEHQGGQRFERGSEPYQTILKWIELGMPYSHTNDATLVDIKVFPAERRYQKEATQPLIVEATYSDGTVKDVTDLADFNSTEKEMAKVDERGLVTVGKISGEGVIVVRFMGLVAISRITVPSDKMLPDSLYASLPVNNDVDTHVYARLKKLGLAPSDLCSDSEFIRRASLDAIGTLPTAEEVKEFLADSSTGKRDALIDRILANPAYADYWAVKWGDLIRPNTQRVGVKSVYLLDQWIRDSFRQNKPYDQFVRELLTAQGNTHQYGPAVVFRDRREPVDASAFVSQIFLGTRMECAKCHHHPNEKWSQSDYYQLAAYFTDVKFKGQGISTPISGELEYVYFSPGGQIKHPVTGDVLKPKPPDGPEAHVESDVDPRVALVDWMCETNNPFFARAAVNRVWAQFMGRGIVDPVDDFRASNPPTNEPLLNYLAEDFVRNGYDLKKLMRTIMRSRVYQLSSIPNEHNLADTRNYSRAYRRRLPAEALSDAVASVTGVPETFQGLAPGARAIETWNNKLDSEFMDAFGRPNSSADCPCERDRQTSVVQALHMMNSNKLQGRIVSKEGRAAQLADSKMTDAEIVKELYLVTYSRLPTAEETELASKAFKADGATRKTATEDIMWALINSAEFVFNH